MFNKFEHLAIRSPLPHHVPSRPGGISFRFAMVHDVIHERFPKHGGAYYEARNQQAEVELKKLDEGDPARWPLMDDLGVGLEKVGRTDEAIPLLRSKLAEQQTAGVTGLELYTSYANLGTFLIHDSFANARLGDAAAIQQFEEGIDFIRLAVEVNPDAHFGREKWQLAIAEFLLETFKQPELLEKYDCLGHRIDLSTSEIFGEEYESWKAYGHATRILFGDSPQYEFQEFFPPDGDPAAVEKWQKYHRVRRYITPVGAEEMGPVQNRSWKVLGLPHSEPVAFDEPVLGIIGMWREGGGANPYFALALGETMLRVGQRFIAWTAYERAKELAERFSPDPQKQEFLREHCRKRQTEIEESVLANGEAFDPEEQRRQYQDELAFGLTYQASYQRFEEQQIAAGVPVDAPDFYAGFEQTAPKIATTPGREELMRYVPYQARNEYIDNAVRNWGLFGGGLGAFVTALLGYLIRRFPDI